MVKNSGLEIERIDIRPVDVELTDDFVISRGSVKRAENAFVRIRLKSGTPGFGEISPFTDLTGEDREQSIRVGNELAEKLTGRSVKDYRAISTLMKEMEPDQPATRCGLETAILDAYCRHLDVPLWKHWGGEIRTVLTTDVTIPILDRDKSMELAEHWYQQGFRTIKMKVGSDDTREMKLIREIHRTCPGVSFILDANQGFETDQAIRFINEITKEKIRVLIFEQPVGRYELDGMAEIKRSVNVPVAADESVFTREDALRVIEKNAADIINLKIMKSGVLESLDIASEATSAGLKLMIGGMVETRLAMSCSLAMAVSNPNIVFLDLDTPLLMKEDPLEGGYRYDGSEIIPGNEPGLGCVPKEGIFD